MDIKIDHVALYVRDLEGMKDFYVRHFGATAKPNYHNPRTGLYSSFLSFGNRVNLELMTRPEVKPADDKVWTEGYIHLAFSLGGKKKVEELTQKLKNLGLEVLSGPRTTGDGYYESCIVDPEGNLVELTE